MITPENVRVSGVPRTEEIAADPFSPQARLLGDLGPAPHQDLQDGRLARSCGISQENSLCRLVA